MADAPAMLFGFIFVLGLFSLSSLSYDEYAHWETYARTLPVSRAALVGGFYNLLFNLNLQYGNNAFSKGYAEAPMHEVLSQCRPSRRGAAARQGVAEAAIRRVEFEILGGIRSLGLGEVVV